MLPSLTLSEFEAKVLKLLLITPYDEVKFIPLDTYYSILAYLESVEDYENCIMLKTLESKVIEKTVDEYYETLYQNSLT